MSPVRYKKITKVSTIIAPSTATICAVGDAFKGKPGKVHLAGQDTHAKRDGSGTGGLAVLQVLEAGGRVALVAHSERRNEGMTNEMASKVIRTLLDNGLIPVYCIGETKADFDAWAKNRKKVLSDQISIGTKDVKAGEPVIFAREPRFAIGHEPPPPEVIAATHAYLRTLVPAEALIWYGGGVTGKDAQMIQSLQLPTNLHIAEFGTHAVDGVLVGGASLTLEKFTPIILGSRAAAEADL